MKRLLVLIAAVMMLAVSALAEDGDTLTAVLPMPLPEGARVNQSHSSEDMLEIFMPDDYSFETCTIVLQPDGRWLLTHVCDTSISENMLWFGVLGPYYGDVLMERDITHLDWNSMPVCYEDFLPLVDASCWAVVTGNGAPLQADDGSILSEYLPATPVLLLEADEGQHRVAVNGSSVTGWMDDDNLLIGENQLAVDEHGYLSVVEDGFMWGEYRLMATEGLPLYDTPEGVQIADTSGCADLLACWPGGWLHVFDHGLGIDGFILINQLP